MSFHILTSFLACLGLRPLPRKSQTTYITSIESKYSDHEPNGIDINDKVESAAQNFVHALITCDENTSTADLTSSIQRSIGTRSWTENLAEAILSKLERILRVGATLAGAIKSAYEKAIDAAIEFSKEHPTFCVVIAIGVLVVMAPYVVEFLGFGELGPVAGSFAARWMARYAGFVPKGSLYSYLQRLGMVWRR